MQLGIESGATSDLQDPSCGQIQVGASLRLDEGAGGLLVLLSILLFGQPLVPGSTQRGSVFLETISPVALGIVSRGRPVLDRSDDLLVEKPLGQIQWTRAEAVEDPLILSLRHGLDPEHSPGGPVEGYRVASTNSPPSSPSKCPASHAAARSVIQRPSGPGTRHNAARGR